MAGYEPKVRHVILSLGPGRETRVDRQKHGKKKKRMHPEQKLTRPLVPQRTRQISLYYFVLKKKDQSLLVRICFEDTRNKIETIPTVSRWPYVRHAHAAITL